MIKIVFSIDYIGVLKMTVTLEKLVKMLTVELSLSLICFW